MKKYFILLFAFILISLFSCQTDKGRSKPGFIKAALFGMIYDFDGQPVSGVRVSIDGIDGPLTDINGRFALPDIIYGKHFVAMKKNSFEDLSVEFTFLNKSQVLYAKMFSFQQLLNLAEDTIAERNWKETHGYLKRAEELEPNDPILRYLYAVAFYKQKDFSRAEKILINLLISDYDEAYIHLLLADIYQYQMKNLQKTIHHLEAFLKLKSNYEIEKRLKNLSDEEI